MSKTVITVQNLSKRYILNHQNQERYTALRDVIANGVKSLGSRLLKPKNTVRPSQEEFWALQDVSFEIKQGDRVGIIGRNGAGKSTLLKILSRITEPTSGRIRINGRVASLLEVGTGFHPELTGRENISLNGAILGMSKVEIQQKFDEIVAFAEVEKFLDTPVKRYSSGMYVRLAFAVAAHLEPEILIVDEVLAVGDAQFQNKCLGKMKDVAHSGRTVIFVSHNMAAIRQLCNNAIFLKKGELNFFGNVEDGVSRYLQSAQTISNFEGKVSSHGIELNQVCLVEHRSQESTLAPIFNEDYQLKLNFRAQNPLNQVGIVVEVYDVIGTLVSSLCTPEEDIDPFLLEAETEVIFNLTKLQLMPGPYRITVYVYRTNDQTVYLQADDAFGFEVYPSMIGDAGWAYRTEHGIVRISNGGQVNSRGQALVLDSKISAPLAGRAVI